MGPIEEKQKWVIKPVHSLLFYMSQESIKNIYEQQKRRFNAIRRDLLHQFTSTSFHIDATLSFYRMSSRYHWHYTPTWKRHLESTSYSHTSWRRGHSRWVHCSSQRPLVLKGKAGASVLSCVIGF